MIDLKKETWRRNMDNKDNTIDQYGLYNSSQYEIEEIMGTVIERNLDKELGHSEYLYEDEAACDLSIPQNYDIDDVYLVTPNDGNNAQDAFATAIRPTKRQKSLVEDIYDEDHYSLARNSGFPTSFSKTPADDERNTRDTLDTMTKPTKSEKPMFEDIYDEDHYSLARNSGFPTDFSKTPTDTHCMPSNSSCLIRTEKDEIALAGALQDPKQKSIRSRNILIVTLTIMVLLLGGSVLYTKIGNIGITTMLDFLYFKIS